VDCLLGRRCGEDFVLGGVRHGVDKLSMIRLVSNDLTFSPLITTVLQEFSFATMMPLIILTSYCLGD
jgi:hypothetical protein